LLQRGHIYCGMMLQCREQEDTMSATAAWNNRISFESWHLICV